MRVLVALVVTVVVLGAAPPATGEEAWVWPVEGRVLTPYSNDNGQPYAGGMHRGIDVAAASGARVVAARAGTVTHAGVVGSSGLTVAVRTADGRHVTSYLHLSAVAVKKGDAVAAGAAVGAVGTTGRRSVAEPHLHFGVRLGDREDHYVDPLTLLPALPVAQSAAPIAPVPVPAPLRAEPQPVPRPVSARVLVAPRAAPAPRPARVRPRGTVHPGAVVAPRAGLAPVRHSHSKLRPARVPTGPSPVRSGRSSPLPAPATRHVAVPPAGSGPGRELVLAGLGVIGLMLFGGMLWRALARANADANAGAAAAAASLRERVRIGPTLRRLLVFR
jgi:hypothetical protein